MRELERMLSTSFEERTALEDKNGELNQYLEDLRNQQKMLVRKHHSETEELKNEIHQAK